MSQVMSRTFDKHVNDGALSRYGISKHQIHNYLNNIESLYREIPYHNVKHAESVMNACAILFDRCHIASALSDAQFYQIILLIAAASHDVDHPGMQTKDFKEEHHVKVAHEILNQNNFLSDDSKHPQDFVDIMDELILKTDMKLHKDCLDAINEMASDDCNLEKLIRFKIDDQNIRCILCVILKCADIWHVVSPWPIHHYWTQMYLDESGYNDFQDSFIKDQIFFLKAICQPCFIYLAKIFPETNDLDDVLETNINLWKWKATPVLVANA